MDSITLNDTSVFEKRYKAYKEVVELYNFEHKALKELYDNLVNSYESKVKTELAGGLKWENLTFEKRAELIKLQLEYIQVNKRILSLETEIAAKKEFLGKYENKMLSDKQTSEIEAKAANENFGILVSQIQGYLKNNNSVYKSPEHEKLKSFFDECEKNKFGFKDNESLVRGYKTLLNLYNDCVIAK
jgi:hypothetical protein